MVPVPLDFVSALQVTHAISQTDTVGSEQALLKLVEEVGELSAAFLNETGAPNKSASSEPNVLEEGVDVLMCTFDVLFKRGYTFDQIGEMIAQKNIKWNKKIMSRSTPI
jgi:hypothetical protein